MDARSFVVSVETILSFLQLRKVFKKIFFKPSEMPYYLNETTDCNLRVLRGRVEHTVSP